MWALAVGGVGALVLGASLILAGSRGSALAAVAGILVLVVLTFNPRRALLYLVMLPIVIIGFGAYLVDFAQPLTERFLAAIEGTSRGARDVIWEVSWELIKERPVFGYGLQASVAIGEVLWGGRAGAAHNSFLTVGLAFGMVGFLLWISFVLSIVWRLWRVRTHPVGTLFLAVCAQLLVASVFNDFGRDKYFWGLAALAAQVPFWVKYYPEYFREFVSPKWSRVSRGKVFFGGIPSRGEHR